jgi:hypothetical protein
MTLYKYVILARDGKEFPAVFDPEIQHSTMVPKGFTPVSAGFVTRTDEHLVVPAVGSESLELEPRPIDRYVLSELFFGGVGNACGRQG